MASKLKEAIEEKKAEDGTDDELEQDSWDAEAPPTKKKPTAEEKKKKEANTKTRKKDAAVIAAGGDFQVQVHIIKGCDLKGKDSGGTSDPVVTVTIFDEKKSTKIKNKTNTPLWDQVLYFELNNLAPDELSRGKALIQVFDADIISRNDLIGAFEFDLSWIYFREHHEVYNQWIGLTNPDANEEEEDDKEEKEESDGIEGIEGYVQLSITILGCNDEQYIHDEEAELANTDSLESGMILVSPGIEQTPYLLTIRIYEARNLAKTDDDTLIDKMMKRTGSKNLDPFFYVEYAGVRLRSNKYQGVNPSCLVEFQIPVMEPVFSKNISIIVLDYDKMTRNDRIGCLKIDYCQLKTEYDMRMEPCWQYIYGAPIGYQSGYARKMNKGLVEGSNYRGKLFMEATVEEKERKQKKRVTEKIQGLLEHERPKMIEYYLRCDLYEGTEINKIEGLEHHMFVQVQVTHNTGRSQEQRINDKNSSVKWYESLVSPGNPDKCIGPFLLPEGWNENPEPVVLPDVFIYLCVKEFGSGDIEQVSYCRVPLNKIIPGPSGKGGDKEFTPGKKRMWENGPVWYDMKENLALDKYKDNVFPGALLIGLNAGPKADISKESNKGKLVEPPALSRPFSNPDIFKAVPTDATPEPTEEDDLGDAYKSKLEKQSSKYQRPSRKRTRANVTIKCYEASGLVAMDRGFGGSSSDPYVEVVIEDDKGNKREKEIEKEKKNLNPKWNQDLEFDNVKVGQRMRLRVLDWDFGPDKDDEIAHIETQTLTGTDFEGWMTLKASTEVAKKYRKKAYLLNNMKIKIGIKYDWDDLDLDEDARQKKKKKGLFSGVLGGKEKKKQGAVATLSEPNRVPMQLRVHCYQARNLENADLSGLSDGYLVVRFCGQSVRTRTVEDHIDPKWYQSLTLAVNVPEPLQYAPRIYCEIYDEDTIGKDASLGRFDVNPEHVWKVFSDENDNKMNDEDEENDNQPIPIWYDLEDAEQRAVSGKALVAFELIDVKQSNYKMPVINPPCRMEKQWMHCITLGLRDIQSTFGVHKPYIEFEMNGNIYRTEKSNRPDSRNPNFCQILKFEVLLPVKEIFLPNLNVTVKDSLFGGLIKRKLGFASIEIEDLMDEEGLASLKQTADEVEAEAIRTRAEKDLAKYNRENNIAMDGAEEDDDAKQEELDAEAGAICFSTDDGRNMEEEPLIKKPGAGTDATKEDEVRIEMKRKALKENQYIKCYEYMKKHTYDLSKTLPDYMKCLDKVLERDQYDDELEDVFPCRPFLKIPFFTGKSPMRTVGHFKGLIAFTKSKKYDNALLKDIAKPIDLYLRLYILTGTKLVPRDSGGASDPYLIIKMGKSKISTRAEYIANTLEPEFYSAFEIPVVMPGPSSVEIEVWDWDGIGDDLIGRTTIDIEDRWYSTEWRELLLKPVETRTLWSDQSTVSQGKLKLWMELVAPSDAKKYPMRDIKPPPRDEFELRVIVWECKDCPVMDTVTNMNDLYITGGLLTSDPEEEDIQQTDLHFRSQNGCGSFNWRMRFPIKLPKSRLSQYPSFQVQIWDKDFFSPSDNISEGVIPLQPFLRYCEKYSKDKRCVLTLDEEEKFWIDLKQKGGGQIKLSFELLPLKIAKLLPAGFGRADPNNNPHLPEPEGRAKFSILDPCTSIRNLLGDRMCCKLVLICLCAVLVALAIFITPNLISAITANLVTG